MGGVRVDPEHVVPLAAGLGVGDFFLLVDFRVGEFGEVDEADFVAGVAFIGEDIFRHAEELDDVDFLAEFFAHFPRKGGGGVFAELDAAAGSAVAFEGFIVVGDAAGEHFLATHEHPQHVGADVFWRPPGDAHG